MNICEDFTGKFNLGYEFRVSPSPKRVYLVYILFEWYGSFINVSLIFFRKGFTFFFKNFRVDSWTIPFLMVFS